MNVTWHRPGYESVQTSLLSSSQLSSDSPSSQLDNGRGVFTTTLGQSTQSESTENSSNTLTVSRNRCGRMPNSIAALYLSFLVNTPSGSRRRSEDVARQQLYLSRNTLHHELQLPDGYGKHSNPSVILPNSLTAFHVIFTFKYFTCYSMADTVAHFYLLNFTEQRVTPQGQVYFIHRATGVSTWHDPRYR